MHGKPTSGQEWPQTHYVNLVQIFQNAEEPSDIQVVQFENKGKGKWVELPNCDGTAGEKKLDKDLSNATVATCKVSPDVNASGKSNSAQSALDSMTPKAE